ncbi:unnamed protein product [Merluccius merluccius]
MVGAARRRRRSEDMLLDLWTSALLVWITCFPHMFASPLLAGPSDGAQTGGSEAALSDSLGGDGQVLLSRAKRGWVWNQMFVLEEFSGPDPILVGREVLPGGGPALSGQRPGLAREHLVHGSLRHSPGRKSQTLQGPSSLPLPPSPLTSSPTPPPTDPLARGRQTLLHHSSAAAAAAAAAASRSENKEANKHAGAAAAARPWNPVALGCVSPRVRGDESYCRTLELFLRAEETLNAT